MKNKEKYAKEIIEIACDWYNIAVNKNTGKPEKCCLSLNCTECLLSRDDGSCVSDKKAREWAESEYIEKPVISKKDRAFLEYLDDGYIYIVRNSYGCLIAWTGEVIKCESVWNDEVGTEDFTSFDGFKVQFPMVKWSDSEPWLIEDLKKLEVVEDYE